MKEPLMALIGRNAVGKTNTLQGIQHASQLIWRGATSSDKEKPKRGFSGEFFFEYKNEQLIYKISVFGTKDPYVRDSLYIAANGKRIRIFNKTSKVKLNAIGRENPVYLSSDSSGLTFLLGLILSKEDKPAFIEELLKYQSQMVHVFSSLMRIKYYGVQSQPDLHMIQTKEFEEWKKDSSAKDQNSHFSCKFYDFYKKRRDDYEEYLSLIKSLCLVDELNAFEFRKEHPAQKAGFLCMFLFKIGEEVLFFENLSDGTKRILRLLFYLLYEKSSLMLIEEPESSIHYGLLAKVLDILQQYTQNKRVLIATHSEQILNQLEPKQLIYLFLDKGETKVKYVSGRNLKNVRKYLDKVGPLGEYITSGELESDLED